MFPSKFEATPVPIRGSGISLYELQTLHRASRAFIHGATPAEPIDLTGHDVDNEPRHYVRSNSLALATQLESLQIRPREQSDQSQVYESPSADSQASPAGRRSRTARSFSSRVGASSSQSKKRKESPERNGSDERWSPMKRRLRPRTYVVYDEDAASTDAMDLDELEAENYLLQSVETDGDDESDDTDDSDTEEWEVKRVVAEKRGPRVHEFLLDWVGSDEQNWIPAKRCRCRDLISDFRAIPRVPADTHYLATLERNRLRRADSGRRTGATRPQNVRPKGPGSFRNPRTGRFEKRRASRSPIRLHLKIPDSDAEDNELDFDVGSPAPSLWRNQDARTPSKTPSLDHFSASVSGSPASAISNVQQPDLSQEYHQGPQETVVWVRKTPMDDDDKPLESPRERRKSVQRPMQTAKIMWIRDTPGFEDEQPSFPRSDGTVIFTSTKTKKLPSPPNHPSKVAEIMVHNTMLPCPNAQPFCFTAINSRNLPSISHQISRWNAIKSNPVPPPSKNQAQPFSVVTTPPKPKDTTSSDFSAFVPANLPRHFNLAQHKPPPVDHTSSHSKCSPGAFNSASSSPRSSPTSLSGINHRATAISKSMPPSPLKLSSHSSPDFARQQSERNVASTKSVTFSSAPPAVISHGRSSSSPMAALRSKRPKPKAKRPLTSPSRRSIKTTPSGSMPPQPAVFSWSPPGSPVRSLDNAGPKRFSEPEIAHRPELPLNRPMERSSSIVPMPNVAAPLSQSEPLIDISDLLDMAASITLASESTHSIPFPKPIHEASNPPEAMSRNSQSMTPAIPGKESHKAGRKLTTDGTGEAGILEQQRVDNAQQPPVCRQKKTLNYHGFRVKVGKNSGENLRSSPAIATPDTMRQSRSPIRREEGYIQKKLIRDQFTRAIEVEVASDAGPHVASKKATGAVLLNASANAFRGPTTTQKRSENNKRSPSVARKWFLAARKKEKEDALARAPKGVRPELNRDLGLSYVQGLCANAKRAEEENFNSEFRRLGLNYSRDTPLPSIEG